MDSISGRGKENFLFSAMFKLALGITEPPLCNGYEGQRLEYDHVVQSRAVVNEGGIWLHCHLCIFGVMFN
jgi:hypothetical protein